MLAHDSTCKPVVYPRHVSPGLGADHKSRLSMSWSDPHAMCQTYLGWYTYENVI